MVSFIFELQRFADISNHSNNTLVSGTSGADTINNSGSNVTINGGDGNDSITNVSNESSINGGKGDDSIYNGGTQETNGSITAYFGSLVTINGGKGNDYIQNTGNNVLIKYASGDGNDLIDGFNETSTLSISGASYSYSTSGNDVIVTVGKGKITLQGAASLSKLNIRGTGIYSINNNSDNTLVSGTSGNDSITNLGSNSSILGGAGNDTISNRGNLTTIWGGDGDDYVQMSDNGGKGGVYVYTGGNDTVNVDYWAFHTIVLNGVSVESSVRADDGHGTLYLSNGKTLDVYPEAGTPHVTIVSSLADVPKIARVVDRGDSFVSLAGANQKGTIDLIQNWGGSKVTITGNKSDYYVLNTGTYAKINTGTGNDNVWNWGGNKSTISTGTGNDNISNSASNVSINSGADDDWIETRDGSSNVTVDAGDGNDDIYDEWGENNILNGGTGNDTICAGKNSTVYAGSGNDRVDLAKLGNKVFLEDGNDVLYAHRNAEGDNYFADGGAGDDSFINEVNNATINGGTGDDFIKNNGGNNLLITYNAGDGNDYVQGFNATSTLQISGGSYSTTKSGSDIIVSVGKDSITLEGAANLAAVNIQGTLSSNTSSGGEGKMITNRTNKKSIAGTDYEDEIFNYANTVTLTGGEGNDVLTTLRKTTGVKIYGEEGDDTLEAYKATKVLLNGGDGNDEIYIGGGSSVTAVGGAGDDTIEIDNSAKALVSVSAAGDGKDIVEGFNSTSTLKIGNGTSDTYSIEKDGDNVIVKVGAGQITLNDAASLWIESLNGGEGGLQNIKGTFQKDVFLVTVAAATLGSGIKIADASKRTKATKIVGNALNNSIVGGSAKDTLYGLDGDDTLDGGKGNDKLFGGDGKDVFVFSAGKDTIEDYKSGEDVVDLGSYTESDVTTSVSGNNGIVKIGSNTLTIKNAKFQTVKFVTEGDDFEVTFGADTLDNSSASPYTAASGIWKVDASARTKATNITGNDLDNTISGGSGKDVIYGLDGTDSLYGGKGNDKLYGGDGEDTLWGGAGNDTLYGGADDDVFVYSGGKDFIDDYTEGEDIVSLNAAIANSAIKGNNVVLTIKKNNTLTLKDAAFKEVSFIGPSGEYTKRFVDEEFNNSSAAKVTLAADSKTAMAEARTKAINITGNELNNSILGGSGKDVIYGLDGEDALLGGAGADKLYGGDGNDTLIGGKGNDSLWGDGGSNTFVYNAGDGKDFITGFGEDDELLLNGINIDDISLSITGTKKDRMVMNFDSSNSITFVQSETEYYKINGTFYERKNTKLVKAD